MHFTRTHVRFGRSHLHHFGQLTHTRRPDGTPDPDGALKEAATITIRHRNIYLSRPDPIAFLPLAVDTSGRLHDDFISLLFLHAHGDHGESIGMRISIPLCNTLDLSFRPFIRLPRFIGSSRPTPLLTSVFLLSGTCWVFIFSASLAFLLIIVLA
jgi:hypothetical protein